MRRAGECVFTRQDMMCLRAAQQQILIGCRVKLFFLTFSFLKQPFSLVIFPVQKQGQARIEEGHHTDFVTFEPSIQLTLYANLQGPPCMNLPPFPALGEKRQTSAAIGCTLMNI